MGTEETLTRGAIQFMTAGTGVQHQEHNRSEKEPLRFIQMWITTRKRGLTPNYGSSCGDEAGRRNQWSHLVSDVADKSTSTPVEINQDANIYVSETEVGKPVEFELKAGRQAYFLCMEGNVDIGAKDKLSLMRHDAAEITGPQTICVTPKPDAENSPKAHFLLVEMKFVAGDGRTDL
jgi:redox-sensitive bicupin YhaK (pirin superfamily)